MANAPLYDLNDEDLVRNDNLAALEQTRGTPSAAQPMGDVDAFLQQSGFYGETTDGSTVVGPDLAQIQLGFYLHEIRSNAIEQRWGHDEHTMLNLAFKDGHHYVEADRSRRAVVEIPAPRDMIRRCFSRFSPWYNSQHSKLSSGMPDYFIGSAEHGTQQTRDAAQYAARIADWVTPYLYSLENRGGAAHWKLMAGNVFIYIGTEWEEDQSYLPHMVGDDGPLSRPDLVFEQFPPHQVWADMRASSIEQLRWLGVDRIMRVSDARARYPDQVAQVFPDASTSERAIVMRNRTAYNLSPDAPFGATSALTPAGGHATYLEGEDDVIVSEFWGRAGLTLQFYGADNLDQTKVPYEVVLPQGTNGNAIVRFPRGLRACFNVWGEILEYGPNIHLHIPFVQGKYSKAAGLLSAAPASVLRPVQQALNWVENLRESGIEIATAPTLLLPQEAQIQRRSLLAGVRKTLRFRANRFGAEPKYLAPPASPVDLMAFEQRLDSIWMDLAASHEVSQAKLPAADISGVAISLLQEQDLSQLGYSGEDEEAMFISALRMAILCVQRFFPAQDPRLERLAGDSPYLLDAFTQSDLLSGLDIKVVRGSALPRSQTARKAEAKELWTLGAWVDKYGRPDAKRLQQEYGFTTSDDLIAEEEIDIQNARDEEEYILALMPQELLQLLQIMGETQQLPPFLEPAPEDDHIVHEHQHRNRLKVLRRDPRVTPMHIMILRAHWMMHIRVIGPVLQQLDPEVMLGAALPATAGMLAQQNQAQQEAGAEGEGAEPGQQGNQPQQVAA